MLGRLGCPRLLSVLRSHELRERAASVAKFRGPRQTRSLGIMLWASIPWLSARTNLLLVTATLATLVL